MAITKVTAAVADDTTDLKQSNSTYTGSLTAPKESGDYPVTVSSYDDKGNVTVDKSTVVEVGLWHTPKTNWTINDRFNYVDYNRIKNNLTYLYELAQEVYKQFSIVDMGANIEDYTGWFTAAAFNAFESNLETINKNIFTQDYGVSQRFFDNGQFIKWDELNRIESATLQMNDLLERQKDALRKLPFRLGAFREVRI